MRTLIFLALISGMLASCEVEPQPINYGSDNCQFCKMTIVDKQHASQIVTTKGRAYKFDAIECMLHYHQDNPEQEVGLWLISDFNNPGNLIDATSATYLVSEQISSPMGANLSGFNSEEAAVEAQNEYTGELFSWKSLQNYLENR